MHVWNETVVMVMFLFRSSGNNKDQIMCNFAGMWYMYTFAKISLYFTWWRTFQNGFWAEHLRWKLYLLLNRWFASNQFPAWPYDVLYHQFCLLPISSLLPDDLLLYSQSCLLLITSLLLNWYVVLSVFFASFQFPASELICCTVNLIHTSLQQPQI